MIVTITIHREPKISENFQAIMTSLRFQVLIWKAQVLIKTQKLDRFQSQMCSQSCPVTAAREAKLNLLLMTAKSRRLKI